MALKRGKAAAADKKSFKEWWSEQPAARRKNIMLLAGLGTVLLLAMMIVGSSEDTTSKKETAKGKIENAMLPSGAAKDLSVSGLTSEVRKTRDNNRDLENKVARLEASLDRYTGSGAEDKASREQKMEIELARLNTELEQVKLRGVQVAPGQPGANPAGGIAPVLSGPTNAVGEFKTYSEPEPPKTEITPEAAALKANASRPTAKKAGLKDFYIPAGTIIQGVLLTGVDAPTGKNAMKDPVPVLARVKDLAILPNFFRADVRECFILLDAVGDMSSERAMMRSSNISCVRKDRSVIDVPIQGFAVGEDGSAGMRGVLISKQGKAMAKATLAGIADGLAEAFSTNYDTVVKGPGGQEATVSGTDALASGAYGGASSALNNISQYYIDLADQLTPVIEVQSGRKFTLIVIRGRSMAPLSDASSPNNGQ